MLTWWSRIQVPVLTVLEILWVLEVQSDLVFLAGHLVPLVLGYRGDPSSRRCLVFPAIHADPCHHATRPGHSGLEWKHKDVSETCFRNNKS